MLAALVVAPWMAFDGAQPALSMTVNTIVASCKCYLEDHVPPIPLLHHLVLLSTAANRFQHHDHANVGGNPTGVFRQRFFPILLDRASQKSDNDGTTVTIRRRSASSFGIGIAPSRWTRPRLCCKKLCFGCMCTRSESTAQSFISV
ncbi:hypothetical protein BCR44DRAFT_300336 [Catenaria anguillulae PL171]|uniref:Uncharacterized protein n=1 Tax=Catenaria anguillulae PL171 TaxID=765915 RepID=A0A1Y2H474_9FUNG|nr:hypothetical protein BCR44DRAFT_300336 [Catenaria anguillulae PL171]